MTIKDIERPRSLNAALKMARVEFVHVCVTMLKVIIVCCTIMLVMTTKTR